MAERRTHLGWSSNCNSFERFVDESDIYDASVTDKLGRFSLQAFVGAEYWIYGESGSSEKGEKIKIKVEKINEPLKIVLPVPKPAPGNH